ncbi:MAG: sugar phosphate isomerase/epimerase family protein [Spirochaetia bacterium]
MAETNIGINLYSLRDYCKTEEDFRETLRKLKEIGYRAVQVSGVNLDPETIKKALDDYGIICCATHENITALTENLSGVIEKLGILDCDFTALGSPGRDYYKPGKAAELAGILEEVSIKLKEAGIRFGYHNHAAEFERFDDKTFMEILRDNTKEMLFEIDTHWVQRGGGDPAAWIRSVAGRIPVIHFKDFSFVQGSPEFSEVGEGNLNWDGIMAACREAGTEWFLVEQDKPFGDRDMFESVKMSYDNMRKMGLQ